MSRKIKKYSGIISAMITPFTEEGKVDKDGIERIIENFINDGASPLLFGTTGETASISQSEKTECVKWAVEKFAGRTKIYSAVPNTSFDDAVNTANAYFDAGIEAVFALLPGYYPINEDQMLNYYENFVESINGPMFFYNIPITTHLSIPLEVMDKLSYHERILGIKDSERDYERLEKSISLWKDRDDFSHFNGWGAQCFNAMWLGSDGVVPSTGCFNVKLYSDMYEAVLNREEDKGKKIQEITMEIADVYQKGRILSQSLPALKVMLSEVGLCGTKVKLPFMQLPPEEEKIIREQTRRLVEKYDLSWVEGVNS